MGHGRVKKIALITSYLPRKCGIATFTSHLLNSLSLAAPDRFDPRVVALHAGGAEKYENPVKFEIRQHVRGDYLNAADYLNFTNIDLVSIQHEFGLFGGEAGSYLSLLLRRLKAPIVTTLHTLLQTPDAHYRKAMLDVCHCSDKLITMNERGVTMLRDIYGAAPHKIELIPHGIPNLPFVDSNDYKHKFGLQGRRTILTFGLLNTNKGIEVMLRALPAVIAADPSVIYLVLGMTHPNVLKQEGESYRCSLKRIVKELHLDDHVRFYNRFVSDEELYDFLCATDVYVTPYHSAVQLTSGTLSFAVGTGKAVVSTPYWAAQELLAQGRGRLVPFGDSAQMGQAIVKILQDDLVFCSMRRRAYDYGRTRTWPAIGKVYAKLFECTEPVPTPRVRPFTPDTEAGGTPGLPDPSLDHIVRLSDGTGLLQHAHYVIPKREHGYCTDDNARGLILLSRYHREYPEAKTLRLLDTYLSFVLHAQQPDGSVRNFMNYDRTWVPHEVTHDALGRTLWALGTVMALAPSPSYISIVKEHFDRSIPLIHKQFPRGLAYSIMGMCEYLRPFPDASDIKRELELSADALATQYEECHYPDWHWFENDLTYDNGVLPHALFDAARMLKKKRYLRIAREACEFLLSQTFDGTHFRWIGCKGWFERGGTRAVYDQQPIEAASMVLLLRAAYDATQDTRYLHLQRKAFDWFLGANDGHAPLYDVRTTGCHDGLTPSGVNLNQGAESTVSYLLSLLAVMESHTLMEPSTSAVAPASPILDCPRLPKKHRQPSVGNV